MDGFGIQANIKVGDLLVNVRGEMPAEFDTNLEYVTEHAAEIIAAEKAVKTAYQAAAPAQGVALLERELGARVIAEVPTSTGFQQTHCQRCHLAPTCKTCAQPCGIPAKSVKNGQFYIHECPSGDRAHKGMWCNEPE